MNNIISATLYTLVANLIADGVEFSIIMQNHNNWDVVLPDRLARQGQFVIQIQEQTLEDSYLDEEGIHIETEFDGVQNHICLMPYDIAGVLDIEMRKQIFAKHFVEYPDIEVKREENLGEPSEEDVQRCMNAFRRYNPGMFGKGE